MPAPETTSPSTTPDRDVVQPDLGRVSPDMTDDQIRDWLRKAYSAIAEDAATEFVYNPEITPKNLESFKALLRECLNTNNQDFKPRFDALKEEIINEIAPRIMPPTEGGDRLSLRTKVDVAPISPNVAQGADPVNLFNGSFVYSATDCYLNGAGMDFAFARTYSQLALYNGPLGFNWDHSYNLWLRVEDATGVIYRSTGELREEVYHRHEQHSYWIPPDGSNGIILEANNSFVLRLPGGEQIVYQPHPNLQSFHVVARVEDRFGNNLNFDYNDALLIRVQVNHPDRVVDFEYDTQARLISIRDFSNRVWRYDYDDLGDLIAVTRPATAQHKALITTYEYTGTFNSDANLQHNLISIVDADGQLYLENEYGSVPNLVSYGRVIRQRQGNGDIFFDYADVVDDFDFPYDFHERPTHQTIVTERDGRQARYLFNRVGNLIFKEEYARQDGVPKLVSYHYRYNRDGNLIGTISPLGAITQALYARDIYERRFPPDNVSGPETDANLTPDVRLGFGHLLAIVKRGRHRDIASLNLAGGLWASGIFPDVLNSSDEDAIQKCTYEPEFFQPLTLSDPRFTSSADPAFVEDAEYHASLTNWPTYMASRGNRNSANRCCASWPRLFEIRLGPIPSHMPLNWRHWLTTYWCSAAVTSCLSNGMCSAQQVQHGSWMLCFRI